jgi:hypothetical protein
MARRKANKTKKSPVKQNSVKNVAITLAEKMTHEFRGMPAQMVTQFKKDIAALKQKEVKLVNHLKKAIAQKKWIQNKNNSLAAKAKGTVSATIKKAIQAGKKAYAQGTQLVDSLTAQIEQTKKHSKTLIQAQAKIAILSKELARFEKKLSTKVLKPKKSAKKARKVSIQAIATPTQEPTSLASTESTEMSS